LTKMIEASETGTPDLISPAAAIFEAFPADAAPQDPALGSVPGSSKSNNPGMIVEVRVSQGGITDLMTVPDGVTTGYRVALHRANSR
jgi:hypothetical protein